MTDKYNLTNHAYHRYLERIGKGEKHHILNRLTQLLENSRETSPGTNNSTVHFSKGIAIVLAEDNYTILTVYRRKPDVLNSDLFEGIIGVVKGELCKEERQLKAEKRRLLIEMHEAEIRKLKVFNPDTQSIIQRKIDGLTTQVSIINDKLRQADEIRKKFKIA